MGLLQSNSRTFSANSQTVDLDVRDADAASIQITGTFTATVTFQVSNDGVNFFNFNGVPTNSATPASSATAAGAWSFDVRPWATLRATTTAYTSGSPVGTLAGKQQP